MCSPPDVESAVVRTLIMQGGTLSTYLPAVTLQGFILLGAKLPGIC